MEKKVSIVFVPGAGMDHRIISMFDLEALYEEYNILGIDLPGHGYTSGPIVDSIRDHTNFCIDVFKEINIKKPIVPLISNITSITRQIETESVTTTTSVFSPVSYTHLRAHET